MVPSSLPAWLADGSRRPLVMGVLNVTPDSFSDGGQFLSADAALARAEVLVAAGADLIDIGAESTRPGSQRVPAQEQVARLRPVLRELRNRVPVILSIDTTRAAVAEVALDNGVDVINDISAGRDDPALFPLAAARNVPIILMHMQGEPATMQNRPHYADVTAEVAAFLNERSLAAQRAGIPQGRILLDPGIGFGKTIDHNLRLLHDVPALSALGSPLVIGTSRKRFLQAITGATSPEAQTVGTIATGLWAALRGASVLRVHDVEPMVQTLRTLRALQAGRA